MATRKPAAKKSAAKKAPAKKAAVKKSPAKKVVAKKVVASASVASANENINGGSKQIKPGALLAEFFGTFLLAGAAIIFLNKGIEYMLAIVALVVVFAVMSGAHFNPAITFAAWINRKIKLSKAAMFIVAQVLGAVLAFFVVQGFVTEQNASYAEDGTRTVATIDSKLVEQGITQEQIDEAGGAEAWIESNGYDVSQLAAQLGVNVQYKVPAVEEHKELFAFWAELVGAIIFGFGAGYALLAGRNHLLKGVAYGGALVVALTLVGSTAILNPAVAFSLGGYNSASVWPYVIYILAAVIGVTLGFSLYNILLKNSDADEE
jgi:glycerol uptake facilitator-like aquaporin